MSTKRTVPLDSPKLVPTKTSTSNASDLLKRYGCGPIQFVGREDALYERYLVFDRVINPKVAIARERFEAFARSIRDVLAQRWVLTKTTYERENAKRIYYISMEFLLGRWLANNVTNLLLDPLVQQGVQEKGIDWLELVEQEPDAGLGNGGLGRPGARFVSSIRWLRCSSQPQAMDCVTSTACSSNPSWMAGKRKTPTTGSAPLIPGRSPGPTSRWKSN